MGDFLGSLKYMLRKGAYVGLLPTVDVFTSAQLKESITKACFEIEDEFQPSKDKAIFLVARKK